MIVTNKIILDVDTGIDDALAILFVNKLIGDRIIGITTCGGNVELRRTTRNTLAVLTMAGANIPVYVGCKKPLVKKSFVYAKYYHGNNGLVGMKVKNKLKIGKQSAVDFIIESANKYPGLTFISTAPATNLAAAFNKDRTIAGKIGKVYMMGGAIKVKGNESDFAETNFFQDPDAVKIIFKNFNDVNLIPLDVTNKVFLTLSDLGGFNNKGRIGFFVKKSVENWFELFGIKKERQFELYDPLAVSVLTDEFLGFSEINANIDVKDKLGKIIDGPYKIKYASEVKSEKFKKKFIETLNSY